MNETEKGENSNTDTQNHHKNGSLLRPFITSIFKRNNKKTRSRKRQTKRQKEEQERVSTKNNRLIQNIGIGFNIIMVFFFTFSIFYQGHFTKQSLEISDSVMQNGIGVSQTDLRPFLWCSTEIANGIPTLKTFCPTIIYKNYLYLQLFILIIFLV